MPEVLRGKARTNSVIANNDALLSLGTSIAELGRLSLLQDSVRDARNASSLRDIGARQYDSAQQSVEQRRFACAAYKTFQNFENSTPKSPAIHGAPAQV